MVTRRDDAKSEQQVKQKLCAFVTVMHDLRETIESAYRDAMGRLDSNVDAASRLLPGLPRLMDSQFREVCA